MRAVGVVPHTLDTYFAPEAATGLIGKSVPVEGGGEAEITGARVDERGLHLELTVPDDAPFAEALKVRLGVGDVSIRPDPLMRVGCVQSPHTLDTHEGRDALREVVEAATSRYFAEEVQRAPVDPAAHD